MKVSSASRFFPDRSMASRDSASAPIAAVRAAADSRPRARMASALDCAVRTRPAAYSPASRSSAAIFSSVSARIPATSASVPADRIAGSGAAARAAARAAACAAADSAAGRAFIP